MKRIGIFVERQRAWGRRLYEGIAAFAQERHDWELSALERSDLGNRKTALLFDGFVARVYDKRVASTLKRLGKPIADVSCELLLPSPFALGVLQDNDAIGTLAARHFLEHRFTHFAFCGFDGKRFSDARRDAFIRFLLKHAGDVRSYHSPRCAVRQLDESIARSERLDCGPDSSQLRAWLTQLPKPVGVFCANDLRAFQVSEACKDCRLKIPDDVAILGVDNDILVCNLTNPSLSSIDPDAFSLGYSAAECLDRILNGDLTAQPRKIPPIGIVPRVSTETFPLDPSWLSEALLFIQKNVGSHLTASDVCAHVQRSHTYVNRFFRDRLGKTIQREIRDAQLAEARRLMTTTDLSLAQIAQRTGFATPQYFTNVFTSVFGHPPSAFRIRSQ